MISNNQSCILDVIVKFSFYLFPYDQLHTDKDYYKINSKKSIESYVFSYIP